MPTDKTFTDLLMNMRRKAQSQGRPLSQQETAGAVAGQAEDANVRLSRNKNLEIQEGRLEMERQRQHDLKSAAKDAESRDRRSSAVSGAVSGGFIGYGSGMAMGGPAGAIIGGALGWLTSSCVIITACTDPYSYEVNVSRLYRDKYMNLDELSGYYRIAKVVVPILNKVPILRRMTKRLLVMPMVDYGEWFMHMKPKIKHKISAYITLGFLGLCEYAGIRGRHHG